jgi:protein-S-isoprenylcysteine O-methyltransferase Ste14
MAPASRDSEGTKARTFALLGSAVFFLFAPGTVAGLVPWWMSRWQVHPPFLGMTFFRVVGGLLIAIGLVILLEAFLRFALKGIGTPAPIYPTRHLVVTGTYRFVRNPMYVAVVWLILGQGLLFSNRHLLEYGLCVWLVMHLFVMLYEEPALRRSFPDDYADFTANVPRWIPRLTPWDGRGNKCWLR